MLFGVGGYLECRDILKTSAAVLDIVWLPGMYDGICRAINTQTEMLRELNRRLDVILTQDCRQVAVPELNAQVNLPGFHTSGSQSHSKLPNPCRNPVRPPTNQTSANKQNKPPPGPDTFLDKNSAFNQDKTDPVPESSCHNMLLFLHK
ncbi:hypothetical protein ILYODFUR_030765 [Ilyodon furcidens]|uniref:Uncharacterized protein n=1 Tax=Ilyodon furcidens TaxID=33524 RepID=A0ABV0SRJ5_9TELE